jgi:hypothetical protein
VPDAKVSDLAFVDVIARHGEDGRVAPLDAERFEGAN